MNMDKLIGLALLLSNPVQAVRVCVVEKFRKYTAPGSAGALVIHKWDFQYDDGHVETVTKRVWLR